jgi:hypothetical protein
VAEATFASAETTLVGAAVGTAVGSSGTPVSITFGAQLTNKPAPVAITVPLMKLRREISFSIILLSPYKFDLSNVRKKNCKSQVISKKRKHFFDFPLKEC